MEYQAKLNEKYMTGLWCKSTFESESTCYKKLQDIAKRYQLFYFLLF